MADEPAPATHQPPQHTIAGALPPFSELADPVTASPRWKVWVGCLENYFVAPREKDGAVKRSPLLHFVGDEIKKLFRHLPNTGAYDDYETAVRTLNAHFNPQLNPDFESFTLRQARRREGEFINQFYARLWELASTCTEDDQQKEVHAQIIQGCRNKTLRGLILRQPNISLGEILIMARSHDLSAARAAEMDMAMSHMPEKTPVAQTEHADAVQLQQTRKKPRPYAPAKPGGRCDYCGREDNNPRDCPAQGRACSNCRKMNHFAAVCKGGVSVRGVRGRRPLSRAIKQLSLDEHVAQGVCYPALCYSLEDSSPGEDEEAVFLISFTNELKRHQQPQPTCMI
ncbi:hypothetical protein NDU88_006948 [Pleurodeles waltl]|uniref:Gag protein n=1 Tax=Pleurodeles waltl TaxID=8319 RepID=A0AAV7MH93_PLEWA|nr:hypothetical protein NDU88_006948 [Pleurodeles waltl]